ncbi:MAG: hypothetical protein AAEJ52_18355 [Myxococcota bacterium]
MTAEQPSAQSRTHRKSPAKAAAARQTRRHPVRWGAEAIGVGAAVSALRAMPKPLAMVTGSSIGRGFARLDSHYRRLAIANLNLVFPDWSSAQCLEFVRLNFAELGRTAAEWARMPSLSNDEVRARVEVNGIEHLKTGFGQGRGALVVTAHYGYWEMTLLTLALYMPDSEITAVARAQPNPYLREFIGQRRNLGGVELLKQNALSVRRALRRNAAVGVLADHYLSERKGGLLAPFLGLPAWSNPGPAVLALSARCRVLIAHIRRVDETRHCLELAPIELPALDDRASRILELTTRINVAIGDIIRREPELWLWSNHSWRGSPAVSAESYPSRRRRRRAARG